MPKLKESTPEKKSLNVEEEFAKLRERYTDLSKKRGFNCLLYGDFGTGKTYSLHTAPRPVFIHTFDPGGSVTLRKWIDKGEVIVDPRFEVDEGQRGNPDAYVKWEKEFSRLRKGNFFDGVGTYAIDSITTMSESLMSAIMTRASSKSTGKRTAYHPDIETYIPQLQDYLVQQHTLRDILNVCCGLPCNFICTGHIDRDKDEVTGKYVSTPMITGKYAQKIPMLFDEVYVSDFSQTSKGSRYYFLTQSDGMYRARSRLAANSPLEKEEEPNFRAILDKTGTPYEEKELFTEK